MYNYNYDYEDTTTSIVPRADRAKYNRDAGWDICAHVDMMSYRVTSVLKATTKDVDELRELLNREIGATRDALQDVDDKDDSHGLVVSWLMAGVKGRCRIQELLATRLHAHLDVVAAAK